jgi:hypothetical protein
LVIGPISSVREYELSLKDPLQAVSSIFAMADPLQACTAEGFVAEYAKSNRSRCKASKRKIAKDCLRIGKIIAGGDNPIAHGKEMAVWMVPSRSSLRFVPQGQGRREAFGINRRAHWIRRFEEGGSREAPDAHQR